MRAVSWTASPRMPPGTTSTSPVWMPGPDIKADAADRGADVERGLTARAAPSNMVRNPSPAVSISVPR